MLPKERDKDLILNILDDAETLEKRIEHFKVTEDSFVNDISFEGKHCLRQSTYACLYPC